MNYNELNKTSELIWSTLNCIENRDLNKTEQIKLIKPILIRFNRDSINTGRRQILNYLDEELKTLRKNTL